MRVLFAISSWTHTLGHIVRSIAVAEELLAEGHKAAFLAPKEYKEWIPAQAEFYEAVPKSKDETHHGFLHGFYTYEDVIYVSGHSQEQHLIDTVERERQVISSFQPDSIFNDEQFTIAISAALEKVPVMSIVTWPLHPAFNHHIEKELPQRNLILRKLRNTWNRVLKRYSQEPIGHLCELLFNRCDILISPTCSAFEPELKKVMANVNFVGRLAPKSMFCDEPDWLKEWGIKEGFAHLPTAYIYLSSLPVGVNKKETYETLYTVVEKLNLKTVFALGTFNDLFDKLPSNSPDGRIRFERFVPGETIMRQAQLAIFPATHSLSVSAVENCVSSLVFPDLFERRYNAECLSRIGLGEIYDVQNMELDYISDLIESLLKREKSEKILRMQKDFKSKKGASEVVSLLKKIREFRER